ncbi:putative cofilin tropomyosin-type actin-binding protein [Rosellinia necatrix]|uniref:Putative cofilin tropomyosin-type actin-binding protein n=1 Tax=Rosellinia necatrix TaxID=77044 RepID=A0A1W2THT5_ROSNE|nr:putative cofilin tropomyosin-type actin-binding protein [Rosellinia necatrix]
MQSGISASQELVSRFNSLLSETSQFGLLVTISSEALTPLASLPRSSPDFKSNLKQLAPYLKPDEPIYALLRRHDKAPFLVAVTYVPDAAKVRQKMLFASTRLTLVRELGTEHFRETIFATVADELSAAGFDRHDKHTDLEAPLTEEERTLGEVKRAEAEAGAGTGVREIHLSSTMSMPAKADALSALAELGQGCGRALVMLRINAQDEAIELVPDSSNPTSISEAVRAISTSEPRFTFFRYRSSVAGAEYKDVLLFFYTNPATAGTKAVKKRMIYPLQKRAVLAMADKECGCAVEKKFEVEDPSEITEQLVLDELLPKVETKTAFKRPKRPGR